MRPSVAARKSEIIPDRDKNKNLNIYHRMSGTLFLKLITHFIY